MLALAVVMVVPIDVLAATTGDPFKPLCDRVRTAWVEGRKIVYIIAGIATLSLGVMAFFGRFGWSKFFAMLGGLFIISFIDQIMSFAGVVGSDLQGPNPTCGA